VDEFQRDYSRQIYETFSAEEHTLSFAKFLAALNRKFFKTLFESCFFCTEFLFVKNKTKKQDILGQTL